MGFGGRFEELSGPATHLKTLAHQSVQGVALLRGCFTVTSCVGRDLGWGISYSPFALLVLRYSADKEKTQSALMGSSWTGQTQSSEPCVTSTSTSRHLETLPYLTFNSARARWSWRHRQLNASLRQAESESCLDV